MDAGRGGGGEDAGTGGVTLVDDADQDFGLGGIGDDVGRAAAFDGADVEGAGAEQFVVLKVDTTQTFERVRSLSMAESPSSG